MTTTAHSVQIPGLVAGTWLIDPTHTHVGFSVRHIMSKVRGQFTTFEGSFQITDDVLDSSVHATIALSSVDTGNSDRDNHLRSSDFFSVEENPTMSFTSTGLRAHGDRFVATGDLTIKGVTKSVDLDVEFLGVDKDPWGGTRFGLEATTTISRKAWGISFNIPLEGDKVVIGDAITIAITVEAVLQA